MGKDALEVESTNEWPLLSIPPLNKDKKSGNGDTPNQRSIS